MSVNSGSSTTIEDVSVDATWRRLAEQANAVLIDVRTRAEWTFVGVPDLATLGKQPILVEWLGFPDNQTNPDFVPQLQERLAAVGVGKDAELYFICRSGARSRSAAQAMRGAGFTKCFNVADGFEGPLDDVRHRGGRAGWKANSLPWLQA